MTAPSGVEAGDLSYVTESKDCSDLRGRVSHFVSDSGAQASSEVLTELLKFSCSEQFSSCGLSICKGLNLSSEASVSERVQIIRDISGDFLLPFRKPLSCVEFAFAVMSLERRSNLAGEDAKERANLRRHFLEVACSKRFEYCDYGVCSEWKSCERAKNVSPAINSQAQEADPHKSVKELEQVNSMFRKLFEDLKRQALSIQTESIF